MDTIIVIGGGLIGVSTAYELVCRGYKTILYEAREGVALETSYANGALLTPSMADPWNAPGIHRHLAASLVGRHSAIKLRASAIPSLFDWGWQFLRNSRAAPHRAATQASFLLAQYSTQQTRKWREHLSLQYDASALGSLKVFNSTQALNGSIELASTLAPLGMKYAALDPDAAIAAEPSLAEIRSQICGAIHYPDDETGDAKLFCERLAVAFECAGGILRLSEPVSSIVLSQGAVSGVRVGGEFKPADLVIVAAGNSSNQLLKKIGSSLPIRPAKGYTVTFDVSHVNALPTMPIVYDAMHAAIVPIGNRLRVAGTAEFAGCDRRIRTERIANLLDLLTTLMPRVARQLRPEAAVPWTGLRPMSSDGLPFIGATQYPGLYINSGHGHLGWTLAVGSAHLLGDLIERRSPDIDPAPYRVNR